MKPANNLREIVNGKEGLVIFPGDYCQNARQSRESAKKLLTLQFDTLTVAQGNPVPPRAREQFARLFST